jgi:hypothetical protein
MEQTALEEHRKARRFDVAWDILVKGRDGEGTNFEEKGVLVNLSSRGAFLRVRRHLAVGKKLEVWIKVPFEAERWMAYSAEVVRCADAVRNDGVGVKFTKVRPRLTDIQ